MNAASVIRYAGECPVRLEIEEAIREAVQAGSNSLSCSSQLTLRFGGFRSTGNGDDNVSEDVYASIAERAYVRWLDLAWICGADHAATLADGLRAGGFDAIRFAPSALQAPIMQVQVLVGERVAQDLAQEFAGRAYLIPAMAWKADKARTILADIQREAERNAIRHLLPFEQCPPEHDLCPERIELFDACEVSHE